MYYYVTMNSKTKKYEIIQSHKAINKSGYTYTEFFTAPIVAQLMNMGYPVMYSKDAMFYKTLESDPILNFTNYHIIKLFPFCTDIFKEIQSRDVFNMGSDDSVVYCDKDGTIFIKKYNPDSTDTDNSISEKSIIDGIKYLDTLSNIFTDETFPCLQDIQSSEMKELEQWYKIVCSEESYNAFRVRYISDAPNNIIKSGRARTCRNVYNNIMYIITCTRDYSVDINQTKYRVMCDDAIALRDKYSFDNNYINRKTPLFFYNL